MTANELRIFLVLLGLAVLIAIYWLGRPRRSLSHAHERDGRAEGSRREPFLEEQRREPVFDDAMNDLAAEDFAEDPDGSARTHEWPAEQSRSQERKSEFEQIGNRPELQFDLIICLHIMASGEAKMSGADLLVAAEKASLVYGAQGLFHRLVDGKPAAGPIFSMVNRIEPGRFELSRIQEVQTPGVSLFMTLPGPLAGLDAWDKMLPAAQRLAGLLNAEIYDEQMNLLGRQRIASIRDELRAYDRKVEMQKVIR